MTLVSADGSCQKLSKGTPMKTFPNTMVGEITALYVGGYPPRRETKWIPFVECCSLVVGKWAVEQLKENRVPGDQGLVLKSRAKHHAVAAMLAKPFVFKDEPLVVQ